MKTEIKLAQEWNDLKAEKEQIEDRLKLINSRIDQIRNNEFPKYMEDNELEKITVKDVGTIYLKAEVQAYVKKDDEPEFFKWLRGHKHGALIKETVHSGTLKSWTKEQLEEGKELPQVLNVHQFMQATLRRK